MTIEIVEESADRLAEYGEISIAYPCPIDAQAPTFE